MGIRGLVVGALGFGIATTAAAYLVIINAEDECPERADAIVVLGGSPSYRLPKAIELFERGIAPVLAVSNPGGPRDEITDALCSSGREGVLCFKPWSDDTRGEAISVARLAAEHGWQSIVLVSSGYHLARGKLFMRQATDARIYAVGSPKNLRWRKWLKAHTHEALGLVDAVLRPARAPRDD